MFYVAKNPDSMLFYDIKYVNMTVATFGAEPANPYKAHGFSKGVCYPIFRFLCIVLFAWVNRKDQRPLKFLVMVLFWPLCVLAMLLSFSIMDFDYTLVIPFFKMIKNL